MLSFSGSVMAHRPCQFAAVAREGGDRLSRKKDNEALRTVLELCQPD